jgi:hypothetical protein
MEFASQIVPAVIILFANLLSGRHGSVRWESVTAIFGYATVVATCSAIAITIFSHDRVIRGYIWQVAVFSLITALSRDYEKILRPLFPWNRD